jgi:hypothetical protein
MILTVFHKNSNFCMKPSGTMVTVNDILRVLKPPVRAAPPPCREDCTLVVVLHFGGTTFSCISRVLSEHNIKTTSLPPRKSSFLSPVQNDLVLEVPGICSILCKCGKVNIRQMERSIQTRAKEHHRHICLYHPEKSAVAEHNVNPLRPSGNYTNHLL